MKFLIPSVLALTLLQGCNTRSPEQEMVRIIFDSDFGPDYDDVGALAFLHAMADSGKSHIYPDTFLSKYKRIG